MMEVIFSLLIPLIITINGFYLTKWRIRYQCSGHRKATSRLKYYGYITAFYSSLSAILGFIISKYAKDYFSLDQLYFLPSIVSIISIIITLVFLKRGFNAQKHTETLFKLFISLISGICILSVFAIILIIFNYTVEFFQHIDFKSFILGGSWNPMLAEKNPAKAFGILPLLFGTIYVSLIAICFASPIAINGAIYLSEYASNRIRNITKPLIEMLAAIPSIVYGYLGLIFICPLVKILGETLKFSAGTENTLSTGILIGMMLIPMILSLADDVIRSIPIELRNASLALGLTKHETIKHVVIPAAKPGIILVIILAISRAIGETMIVIMCAGLNAEMKLNPFQAVSTFTAQITNLLSGDDSFDSPKTLAAFALAFFLIIFTMGLNIIATKIVKFYQDKYGYSS